MRNEEAGDFFALIQAWQQLCAKYPVGSSVQAKAQQHPADDQPDDVDDPELSEEVFEVEKLLAVKHEGSKGLLFKVLCEWLCCTENLASSVRTSCVLNMVTTTDRYGGRDMKRMRTPGNLWATLSKFCILSVVVS